MQPNDVKDKTGPITVLLVDDEESVLESLAELLEVFGHKVISAESGQKAIDAIKQNNEIDVVVLNAIMPDMNGIQTLYQIRMVHPQLPVILSSGYNYLDHINDFDNKEWDEFIFKPYNVQDLIQKLQAVLVA